MNTFGSYECTCPIGYALREDQKMCKGKAPDQGGVGSLFVMLEIYFNHFVALSYLLVELCRNVFFTALLVDFHSK